MRTRIQKWGRSLAVRIPKAAAEIAGLTRGSEVHLESAQGCLTIRTGRAKKYTLAQLLKGVTRKNRHREFDWGPPVGREVW